MEVTGTCHLSDLILLIKVARMETGNSGGRLNEILPCKSVQVS